MSSGMDSGMIVSELIKQKVPFKCYSVIGSENRSVLEKRYELIQDKCELEVITISPEMWNKSHNWLLKNIDDWKYTIENSRNSYNEHHMSIWDDNGANNLGVIAEKCKRDNIKIYISGSGADEMYDYGDGSVSPNGVSKYSHSNFLGRFCDDLSTLFPWKSVFHSSMQSYLAKEEYVLGSFGIEGRYAFINKEIWQEFLWLTVDLKNQCYKSAMHNYLTINNFPFCPGQKIGF
jgi:asparagine synthetase B (glutamine-hydrolysing)